MLEEREKGVKNEQKMHLFVNTVTVHSGWLIMVSALS